MRSPLTPPIRSMSSADGRFHLTETRNEVRMRDTHADTSLVPRHSRTGRVGCGPSFKIYLLVVLFGIME